MSEQVAIELAFDSGGDLEASGLAWRPGSWLDAVFLVGLAGVFLVNAIVAVVHPDDFVGLVAGSSIGRTLGLAEAGWVVPLIAANDLALGLAVLAAARWRAGRRLVLAWSGVWLLGVTLVKVTALG
jgi:hypothetical protein